MRLFTPMRLFRRYYIISTTIVCVVVALSILSGIGSGNFSVSYAAIPTLVAAVPFVPILRQGGVEGNRRLSICISGSLASAFAIFLGSIFLEFIGTKGGEGPNGEGSPLAIITAMTFFATLFVCPWLLTALRGMRLWNYRPQVEQGGGGNSAAIRASP